MSTPPPGGLPRPLTVVVPLRRGAGPGAHTEALATARGALEDAAARWGGRVDWDTLSTLTGPLVDLLADTRRDDLSGLQATAMVLPQ